MTTSDRELETFRSTAKHFCTLAESARDASSEAFLVGMATSLSSLIAAAFRIPPSISVDETTTSTRPSLEAVQSIFDNVRQKIGKRDAYWIIYDPWTRESPVQASFADDIRGVYLDVKEGLLLVERGQIEEALWHWRFSFFSHWGYHAANALRIAIEELGEAPPLGE